MQKIYFRHAPSTTGQERATLHDVISVLFWKRKDYCKRTKTSLRQVDREWQENRIENKHTVTVKPSRRRVRMRMRP